MTNWVEIRNAYLHGSDSLRGIARRFSIPQGTILAKAAAEDWSGQRNRIQASAIEAAEDSARSTLIETLNRERSLDLSTVARMRLLLDDLLAEADRPSDLKLLAQTLCQIQTAVRVSLHLPTIPLKVAPDCGKALRDYTNSELIESLLIDPSVRARLAVAGLDPASLTDKEVIDFCLNTLRPERGGS
jgi:hypothetical protein